MPIFIPWIITGIATVVALVAVVDSNKQRDTRHREEEQHHQELARCQALLHHHEVQYEKLRVKLGERNHQVVALLEDIKQLRAQINTMSRRRF